MTSLTSSEISVLRRVARDATYHATGVCTRGVEGIARETGYSRRSVQSALRTLVGLKLLAPVRLGRYVNYQVADAAVVEAAQTMLHPRRNRRVKLSDALAHRRPAPPPAVPMDPRPEKVEIGCPEKPDLILKFSTPPTPAHTEPAGNGGWHAPPAVNPIAAPDVAPFAAPDIAPISLDPDIPKSHDPNTLDPKQDHDPSKSGLTRVRANRPYNSKPWRNPDMGRHSKFVESWQMPETPAWKIMRVWFTLKNGTYGTDKEYFPSTTSLVVGTRRDWEICRQISCGFHPDDFPLVVDALRRRNKPIQEIASPAYLLAIAKDMINKTRAECGLPLWDGFANIQGVEQFALKQESPR